MTHTEENSRRKTWNYKTTTLKRAHPRDSHIWIKIRPVGRNLRAALMSSTRVVLLEREQEPPIKNHQPKIFHHSNKTCS
jgi:hypothetical protein